MPGLRYAVIDVETTGLDPAADAVVSIAVVPVDVAGVGLERARHLYVDPQRHIPAGTTVIHGISDSDVSGAPSLPQALDLLAPDLAGAVIVGHNLGFDLAFLATAGYTPDQTLDTLAISRLLWRRIDTRHTLDQLAARVAVQPVDRHTALGDAMATAEVLVACLPLLRERGLETPEEVARAYAEFRSRRGRLTRSIRRRSIPRPRPRRGRRLR